MIAIYVRYHIGSANIKNLCKIMPPQRLIGFEYIRQCLEAGFYYINQLTSSLGLHSITIATTKVVIPNTALWRPYAKSMLYNG